MSSRHFNPDNRPLIDLIPDHNPTHDLDASDVSDEEDAFYALEEGDYLLHPKWRVLIARTTNRIPRRLQRYLLIYLVGLVCFLATWPGFIGPRFTAYMQDSWDMDASPKDRYGMNKRPEFEDMVQIKRLDEKLLPKGGGRLVVVGDVHGCREQLEALLRKVAFKEGRDHLVLTGDIIAKGPDSPGVVSLATRLNASCVRGNHEDRVLLSLTETFSSPTPATPGPDESPDRADDTLSEESFSHGDYKTRKLAKSLSTSQISYLQSCPVILVVGTIGSLQEIVVVHAGLVPDIKLDDQDPFQVMNMRTIALKTRLPSETRDGKPWEMFWNHQMKKKPIHERINVIYGHDSKRGLNVQKWSFGLDSGCVSGGRLTAMVIEESGDHKFVSVTCTGLVITEEAEDVKL